MSTSFSYKGRAAILDLPTEISRSEFQDYMSARSPGNAIPISQGKFVLVFMMSSTQEILQLVFADVVVVVTCTRVTVKQEKCM